MISIKNYLCYAYYKICQKKASDLFLFFFAFFAIVGNMIIMLF